MHVYSAIEDLIQLDTQEPIQMLQDILKRNYILFHRYSRNQHVKNYCNFKRKLIPQLKMQFTQTCLNLEKKKQHHRNTLKFKQNEIQKRSSLDNSQSTSNLCVSATDSFHPLKTINLKMLNEDFSHPKVTQPTDLSYEPLKNVIHHKYSADKEHPSRRFLNSIGNIVFDVSNNYYPQKSFQQNQQCLKSSSKVRAKKTECHYKKIELQYRKMEVKQYGNLSSRTIRGRLLPRMSRIKNEQRSTIESLGSMLQ